MDKQQNNPDLMIFVEAYLDLYGLEPYTFRLLAHIARRGQRNDCVSSLEKMATVCKMGVRKAQDALEELYRLDIVTKESRHHQPSACRVIQDVREWAKPKENWKDSEFRTALQKERQDSFVRWKEKQEFNRISLETRSEVLDKTRSEVIFVHGYLDLYGLDPYAFRLLAHIARRGTCVDSIGKIAAICRIGVRKVQSTLGYLYQEGLITRIVRKSQTNWYKIAPINQWDEPSNNWENQRYLTRLKTYEVKYKTEPEKYASRLAKYQAKLEKYTTELNQELAKVRDSMLDSGVLTKSITDNENNYDSLPDFT